MHIYLWDSRERSFAVVCKISVGVPSFAEVHRSFNNHSSRTESFEGHDQVSKLEFRFEIKLNGYLNFKKKCYLLYHKSVLKKDKWPSNMAKQTQNTSLISIKISYGPYGRF